MGYKWYKGYIAHVPINTNTDTTADGRNSEPVELYKALCYNGR